MFIHEWLIILVVFLVLMVAYYIGFFSGKSNAPHIQQGHPNRISSIQAGLIGLLGVMLAFSLSISSQRFEQRRQLVIQESLCIGTSYFRAGLLPDTLKTDVRKLLYSYLNERINFYAPGNSREAMQEIQTRSEQLQVMIWFKTAMMGKSVPNLNTNLNILSLNSMIDISGNISSNFQSQVPQSIGILLTFISVCTVGIIGYSHGLGQDKNLISALILNSVLCATLFLILDLDTPTSGLLRSDTYSLVQLRNEIRLYHR